MSPGVELSPLEQLRVRFAALQDPRVERTRLHQLLDIITILSPSLSVRSYAEQTIGQKFRNRVVW